MKQILLFGFLTWLVPFLVAIPFYTPEGSLIVEEALFKSVMVVVGAAVGVLLLVRLFSGISSNYVQTGAVTGIVWLLMNMVLDLVVLIGLLKMDPLVWLMGIGVRYLVMPLFAAGAGLIAGTASGKKV
jgi:hypothetical protein